MLPDSEFFNCENCRRKVALVAPGTKNRDHCPFCLFSKHVDIEPGDREAVCSGLMSPVGKMYKEDGEELLVTKCQKCGKIRKNRVAGDDSEEELLLLNRVESLDKL